MVARPANAPSYLSPKQAAGDKPPPYDHTYSLFTITSYIISPLAPPLGELAAQPTERVCGRAADEAKTQAPALRVLIDRLCVSVITGNSSSIPTPSAHTNFFCLSLFAMV